MTEKPDKQQNILAQRCLDRHWSVCLCITWHFSPVLTQQEDLRPSRTETSRRRQLTPGPQKPLSLRPSETKTLPTSQATTYGSKYDRHYARHFRPPCSDSQ